MKKTSFTIFLLLFISTVYAQLPSRDLDIKDWLMNLSNKYNIHFAYPSPLINNVKIHYRNQNFSSVDDELKYYLSRNNIEYQKVNESHIMLRKKIQSEPFPTLHITGKIVDTLTANSIAYVGIYLSDFSISTMTDENGSFKISIPGNKQNEHLVISQLGFKEKNITVENLIHSPIISLVPSQHELNEVIITFVAPFSSLMDKDGAIELNRNTVIINKAASARGSDINAALQLLPGITAHEDDDAGIKIRGGNAEETMIVLDEIPLYNATHYYGFFNAVNPEYIDQLQLYKNNLPIEYQGGVSGLLKLNSKHSVADTSKLSLSANSFMTSAILDSKINKNVGLTLAGRSTYGNINLGMDINNTSTLVEKFQHNHTQFNSIVPDYHFYDINAKLKVKISKKLFTTFNYYKSDDEVAAYTEINIKKSNFGNELKKDLFSENKRNSGASINSTYLVNNKSSIKFSLHHSGFILNKNIVSLIQNFSSNNENALSNTLKSSENLKSNGLKLYLDQHDNKFMDKIGIEYINYISENLQLTGNTNAIDNNISARLLNIFNEYHLHLGKVDIKPAFRISSYVAEERSKLFMSPQLNINTQISKNSFFKAASALNNQFIREINFEDPFGQQLFITGMSDLNSIPVSRSWNSMIGYNISSKNIFFDVELWYKKTSGAVSLLPDAPPIKTRDNMNMGGPPPLPGSISYSLVTGERKAKGLDIMVGFQNKIITSWLSYTLSKTLDQYKQVYEGLWFSSPNDRRHQLKLSNNFKVNRFNFSINYIFSSGKPYLAYEMVDSKKRNDRINRDQLRYLPAYHRIDLGAMYYFQLLKKEVQLGFSVFNLLNRENLNIIQYNYKIQSENQNSTEPAINNNLTLGTTYGLINRMISFEFRIKI